MNGKRILLSSDYLHLLACGLKPTDIIDATDFARFLNDLKWRLKGQGQDEIFNDIIREEIRMYEIKDGFV